MKLYNASGAAEAKGCNVQTVINAAKAGRLKSITVHGPKGRTSFVVSATALKQWSPQEKAGNPNWVAE